MKEIKSVEKSFNGYCTIKYKCGCIKSSLGPENATCIDWCELHNPHQNKEKEVEG